MKNYNIIKMKNYNIIKLIFYQTLLIIHLYMKREFWKNCTVYISYWEVFLHFKLSSEIFGCCEEKEILWAIIWRRVSFFDALERGNQRMLDKENEKIMEGI